MKKVFAIMMITVLMLGITGFSAFAETGALSAEVFVTVSDKDGKLALAREKVTVTDTDSDGTLTVNDALYAAHEAKYEGGARTGYASSETDYGLSLDKLWGTANGGSYGYYVNHASALSLAEPVKEGDCVAAFVYTDLTAWSDTYCWFDADTAEITAGKELTLTLSMAGYDAQWNPVTLPAEGAVITVNGEKTGFKTDKDGKVAITLSDAGSYIISAVSDDAILVPPVCAVTVSAAPKEIPKTGDSENIGIYVLIAAISLGALAILSAKRRAYEN